jgi:transposase-like protein
MRKQRRHFSAQFKLETVLEGLRGEKSIAELCRERNIKDALYYKWRDQFQRHAAEIFDEPAPDRSAAEQEGRIAELERLVGRLTLENEVLKKAQSWRPTPSRRNGS